MMPTPLSTSPSDLTDAELLVAIKLWRIRLGQGDQCAAHQVAVYETEMSGRFGGATTLAAELSGKVTQRTPAIKRWWS